MNEVIVVALVLLTLWLMYTTSETKKLKRSIDWLEITTNANLKVQVGSLKYEDNLIRKELHYLTKDVSSLRKLKKQPRRKNDRSNKVRK